MVKPSMLHNSSSERKTLPNYLQCTTPRGGSDVSKKVRKMKPVVIIQPPAPDPDNRIAFKEWKLDTSQAEKQRELVNKILNRHLPWCINYVHWA